MRKRFSVKCIKSVVSTSSNATTIWLWMPCGASQASAESVEHRCECSGVAAFVISYVRNNSLLHRCLSSLSFLLLASTAAIVIAVVVVCCATTVSFTNTAIAAAIANFGAVVVSASAVAAAAAN